MRDLLISQFLDTVGDGSGTYDAVGNYSGAAEEFLFVADAPCVIYRMIVGVEDTTGMSAAEYGNLGSALTNGIVVEYRDENDVVFATLTGQDPVHTNAEWGYLCYDVNLKEFGVGNQFLLVRWTFANSGKPVQLNTGQKLVVRVNDDLTGLVEHRFLVQGHYT